MKKRRNAEKGQAIILFVLAIVALLGFTALAVDGGMAYADRRQAQNAADTAALAGALTKANYLPGVPHGIEWWENAMDRAASNGYDSNGTTNTVDVYSPPMSGVYIGNNRYVQVIITSRVETAFAHFVYEGPVQNTVEALARFDPGEWGPLFPGDAIVGLKPDGCNVVWAHGSSGGTDVEGGGIFVNSNDPNCAFSQDGSRTVNVPDGEICVVGGAEYAEGTIIPEGIVRENCGPARTYPPTEFITPPTCTTDAVVIGNTMTPGRWVGNFPPSHVDTLDTSALGYGIYCVEDGDFKLGAHDTLSGTNVLIYMTNGDIQWDGGAQISLDAPDEGVPYQGLLIFHDLNGHTGGNTGNCSATLNGNSTSTFVGTIFVPSCDVNLLGTGDDEGWYAQLIAYTVEVGGTNDMYIYYDDAKEYTGMKPPKLELTK